MLTLQFCFVMFLASLLYLLLVVTYRLRWHPLARYPGPLLARISDWYAAYHAFQGDIHLDIFAAHQNYGSIIRYGPNRVLVNTAEALQDIYHSTNVKKSRAYLGLVSGPPNVHNAIDKNFNLQRRRAIRAGLTEESIRAFEPNVLRKSNDFVSDLSDNCDDCSRRINVADYCKYLIFDVTSEFCFGQSFNLLRSPAHRYMIHGIAPLHRFNSMFVQSLDLARYHLEKLFCPKSLWYGWKFLRLAHQFATQKASHDDLAGQGLVSTVWQHKSTQEEELTLPQLWSEVKFLMVTGSGSPASALAATLFYTTHNPSCYTRLVAEIRNTFPKASDIHCGQAMSSCRYLHACITEALRMSPPVGGVLWREVEQPGLMIREPQSGVEHHITPGYDVGTGIYAIHHNAIYFPDPFKFCPERWLDGEAATLGMDAMIARRAFTAFSMGPRGCLGGNLAMTEIQDTLALLLWRCDVRVSEYAIQEEKSDTLRQREGSNTEFRQRDHIISFFDGPWVEVKKRQV